MVAAAPVLDEERGVAYLIINRDQGSLLHAWSLTSNRILWSHPFQTGVQATPTVLKSGMVIVADLGGFVNAIEPDGALRFRYAAGCDYLVAGGASEASGTFFIGDPLGYLHAINRQGISKPIFEAKRSIQARPSFDPTGNLFLPSTDRTVYVLAAKQSGGE
jgi:hypothetical protein